MATPRLFEALRIPLERGRLLADGDTAGSPPVAVINQTAARLYWPGEDPVGRTIRYFPQETSPSIRIVGIVGDVRSMGAATAAPPAVHVPYDQAPRPAYEGRSMTLLVRAERDAGDLVGSARSAVASIDPGLPLANVRPMSAVVAASAGQSRFTTRTTSSLAVAAFLLAALGLYGVLAYAVEQRMREIGIRIALGARRPEILRMIVGDGMRLAAIALALGLPAAVVLTRAIAGLLSGVSNLDPFTYAAVVASLAATALVASFVPARRATRIDPVVALRGE